MNIDKHWNRRPDLTQTVDDVQSPGRLASIDITTCFSVVIQQKSLANEGAHSCILVSSTWYRTCVHDHHSQHSPMLLTLCQKWRQARSCSLDFKMCVGRGQTQNLSEILTSKIKKKKLWRNSVHQSLQTLLRGWGWRMCLLCYFDLLTYRFILYTLLKNRDSSSDMDFREFVNLRKMSVLRKSGRQTSNLQS